MNTVHRTLELLRQLTPEWVEQRSVRGRVLLPYAEELPEGYAHMPVEGYAEGWAFGIGKHFNAALDIELQHRTRRKEFYYAYTQGSVFDFHRGYTMYSGKIAIQVQDALPAVPAQTYIKSSWPVPPDNWRDITGNDTETFRARLCKENARWMLRVMMKRNPGLAVVQTYTPSIGPTAWKKDKLLTMTQDQLVRLLITGEKP
jgi:hypothetical protein